VKNLTVY